MSNDRPTWKLFNWKLFDQLAKAATLILILGLGFFSCSGFWFSGASGNSAAEDENELSLSMALPGDPQQIFADFTSGAWRIQDAEWDFRILSSDFAPPLEGLPTTLREPHPDFNDQARIDQFRELGAEPIAMAHGWEKWESSGQGFALVLFTHHRVVQMMRTQLPTENGVMTIEAVPKSSSDPADVPMLPLIEGARQTAVRVDPNGRVISAIIQLNKEKQIDIRNVWKETGWEVTPNPDFDTGDSDAPLENAKFHCFKDGAAIEATFLSQTDDPQTTIILSLQSSSARLNLLE